MMLGFTPVFCLILEYLGFIKVTGIFGNRIERCRGSVFFTFFHLTTSVDEGLADFHPETSWITLRYKLK